MNDTSRCEQCGWLTSVAVHSDEHCALVRFQLWDSEKYDMISIASELTPGYNFNYVVGNLKNVYPKIASRYFYKDNATQDDIFVEKWAAEAIKIYIKNDGFGGIPLSEFLDKMSIERHVVKKT